MEHHPDAVEGDPTGGGWLIGAAELEHVAVVAVVEAGSWRLVHLEAVRTAQPLDDASL